MRTFFVTCLMALSFVGGSVVAAEKAEVVDPTAIADDCTGSMWCAPWEHCLGGKCVNKDVFNKCWNNFDCVFPEQCVDGVCVR